MRQAELSRYERVSGLGGLMQEVYTQLWAANNVLYGAAWHDYLINDADPANLRRAAETLERAPVHEAGNWRIVSAAIRVREAGFAAAGVLERTQGLLIRNPTASTGNAEDEIRQLFDVVNEAMAPIVRALAYDYFEGGPLSEWKEHLDFPDELIPKHRKRPSIRKANRLLAKQWRRQQTRARKKESQTQA